MTDKAAKSQIWVGILLVVLLASAGCRQSESADGQNDELTDSMITESQEIKPISNLRIFIVDTGTKVCKKCKELGVPYFGARLVYEKFPIFFARYHFPEKYFALFSTTAGDRGLIIRKDTLRTNLYDVERIDKNDAHVEWGDSSLYFHYSGTRTDYAIYNEHPEFTPYAATHYVSIKGKSLIHAIFEDYTPPYHYPDRNEILKLGMIREVENLREDNPLKISYKGESAEMDNIRVTLENQNSFYMR